MMCLTLKHQLFNCYEDMDLDCTKVPEEVKELKKFMQTRNAHERHVDGKTLCEWVENWPSQCIYTSQ